MAMEIRFPISKLGEAKKYRTSGQVHGVAKDAINAVWLEVEAPGGATTTLRLWEEKGAWKMEHRCSVARSGKCCWHMAVAVDIAREVLGLKKLTTGDERVDVSDTVPPTPGAGALEDWTFRIEGHVFTGKELATPLGLATATTSSADPASGDPSSGHTADAAGSGSTKDSSIGLPADAGTAQVAKYLAEQGIEPVMISLVLQKRRRSVPAEYRGRVPTDPRFTGLPDVLRLALACFVLGKNLLAVGPKSSGKTTLVHTLAWVFNLPLFEVNGSGQTDVADLRGEKSLDVDPITEKNIVTYVLGTVAEAMQAGGLGYVDEFSVMKESIAIWLNGLDWRRAVEVPGFGIVKAHESFRLALSGNKGYAGCVEPNESTVDRTTVIEMPYTERVAPIIMQESRNKDMAVANKLQEFFSQVRQAIAKGEIRTAAPLTVRGLVDAADYMSLGIPAKVALRATVVGKIWDEDFPRDREKVASFIDALF